MEKGLVGPLFIRKRGQAGRYSYVPICGLKQMDNSGYHRAPEWQAAGGQISAELWECDKPHGPTALEKSGGSTALGGRYGVRVRSRRAFGSG